MWDQALELAPDFEGPPRSQHPGPPAALQVPHWAKQVTQKMRPRLATLDSPGIDGGAGIEELLGHQSCVPRDSCQRAET